MSDEKLESTIASEIDAELAIRSATANPEAPCVNVVGSRHFLDSLKSICRLPEFLLMRGGRSRFGMGIFRNSSLIVLTLLAAAPCGETRDVEGLVRIARLIDGLGDKSYVVRESTGKQLEAVGEPALPSLRFAIKNSRDPEIRYRARRLVGKIMATACQSKSTGLKLVLLHGGEFTMGSTPKELDRHDDEQQHLVRITQPFLIGACEVTQDEYRQVMNLQPSWFATTGSGRDKVAQLQTGRFPVDSVSWYDAIEFCNRLSERDRFSPYYKIADAKRTGNSMVAAKVTIVGGLGYRLPTEAEWEYACRGGTATPYHFGSRQGGGNYQYMSSTGYGTVSQKLGRTTTIASFSPNAFGIYDMHGNVAEWCWDWYDKTYYSASPATDPRGPDHGDHRVLRGGAWLVKQSSCRSATRFWHTPAEGKYFVGFRVARDPSHYMITRND
ncbi:MAG: formylglycine-generating enzyme family protein [Planctomycetota bacterium]|nr:formylglycine-generating enzyme family protein [Planctomycetota bacterium]